MSQFRQIFRRIMTVAIGIGLMAGMGYFVPSLCENGTTPADQDLFVRQIAKQRLSEMDFNGLPAYDAYLAQSLERAIELYVGEGNVRAVVRTDLSVRHQNTFHKEIIADSGVVREEHIELKEDGASVKNTVFDYSTRTTHTKAVFYDVRKMSVLVFLTLSELPDDSFLKESKNLQQLIQSAIGLDLSRGDVFQLIQMPRSVVQKGFLGSYDLQIRQIIAVALICITFIFLIIVGLIPYLMVKLGHLQPTSVSRPIETRDKYQYQIMGNLEENLSMKAQKLCRQMPEAAVNVLRNWLSEEMQNTRCDDLFSPAQKAAIVLLCLGEKNIKDLFKRMTDNEIFSLSRLMASLGQVKANDIQPILIAFYQSMSAPQDIRQTKPMVESLIRNTLPVDKANALLNDMKIVAKGKSVWTKMNQVPTKHLSSFLAGEYPQTAAVILYHLSTEKAADVLAEMDEQVGTKILIRLSALQYLNPDNVRVLEMNLEKQIDSLMEQPRGMGEKKASAILSLLDCKTQNRYMTSMEQVSPQTAGILAKHVFGFDDLARWSGDDLRILLKHIDSKTLILALANAKDETKEAFSRVIVPQKWGSVLKKINHLPTGKIQDMDMSQRAVIQIAQQLIESKKCKGGAV